MGPFPLGRVKSSVKGPSNDQPPDPRWRFHPPQLISLGVLVTLLLLVACDADALQSTFGTAGPAKGNRLYLFSLLYLALLFVSLMVDTLVPI